MLLRRCAASLAGASGRGPWAALARGGPAVGRTWRAMAAPSAARSVVTSPPRWAAAGGDEVLPDLPGAGADSAGEVGHLYDSYVAEGATRGIVDFVSSPSYYKQREEPLPEVRMSNHSKHAIHISRHKLNDICRTIRGLSVHVSRPVCPCSRTACASQTSSHPSCVDCGCAGGGRPAFLLAKASGNCGAGFAHQGCQSCQGPGP